MNNKEQLENALKKVKTEFAEFQKRISERKENPYRDSDINTYLEYETWFWKDALIILAGGNLVGADINWDGYFNFAGVHIDSPVVNNIAFLDLSISDHYDLPIDEDIKGWEDVQNEKRKQINTLSNNLDYLYKHWKNSLINESRNPPKFYIDWALTKSYHIPWLQYAIDSALYVTKASNSDIPVVEKPLSKKERQTLLVIIAALAKESGINLTKTSKAGELIANMTQLIGAPIGATTIENHLKDIPDALESRAK